MRLLVVVLEMGLLKTFLQMQLLLFVLALNQQRQMLLKPVMYLV